MALSRDQTRRRGWALPATVGALLLLWLAWSAYVGYRFDQHSVTVDARIIGSDLGCVGAYGSGTTSIGSGNSITYAIELLTRSGTVTAEVTRPCAVVPPEFGRGRGFIWVQYDQDNPNRIRVLNDGRANVRPLLVATLCIG